LEKDLYDEGVMARQVDLVRDEGKVADAVNALKCLIAY
jgi:hypothetical protein